ncbi:MAG: hypothetical protein A2919_01705 [Candidatus Spechtbacteria bacterium RIFCSPLOWO2_01_FULL_43_12]|uniref:Peptidase C39-like domain-containing protein n=1 Tax=Candidatus Spechtbacteria bacterium RIFCSPLOWO2_01_FULL_43_12 TaxID=1802162 RepID=A0A1G2HDM4_9BACT|nr:MAG: hypothetical protein A2919_01705 [Candidatus Spechtbacteria bacterium RIFCSPLOWO2_01_FULL_43_12]
MKITGKIPVLLFVAMLIVGGWFFFAREGTAPSVDEGAVDFIDPSQDKLLPDEDENADGDNGSTDIPQTQAILLNVPFSSQAPFGNWDDTRQQDGCEEVSVIMAVRWARGQGLTLAEAEQEIIAISDWEQANYGQFHDSSAKDTVERIFRGYFGFTKTRLVYDITVEDIKSELYKGNLVIVSTNGKKLNNPYFTDGGPDNHMFPVIGYDPNTKEFITNDNGTRRGEKYRYHENVLKSALRDYPTGYHEPNPYIRTAMIVVSK